MLKKINSVLLLLFLMFNIMLPASANISGGASYGIKTHLSSDLNVNQSSKGQIVQFISDEAVKTSSGAVIPKGTLFNGKISAMKKSRFGFRRAKAKIIIDELVLPGGRKFAVSGNTARHVYKGSAAGNIIKGVIGVPAALVTGAAGTAVIIVEACTIIGILLIPGTAAVTLGAIGKLTNGVNCKKEAGSDIKLLVKIPSGIIINEPVQQEPGQTRIYTPYTQPSAETPQIYSPLKTAPQTAPELNQTYKSFPQ